LSLNTGTRLGPYEIIGLIGAGGMGEVYKSRDTRLERTVAVKVVSGSLASDPTWRQRFDREARVLATLSNPHICPIFDVGRHDGVDFLVMEYLEGEALTARLARSPLPLDQALRYAIEIADALAAAHREGICHRDLKPGNIMLTRSGARLLDFGLARVGGPRSHPSDQQTLSSELTATGTILGTVQYMAPEQLEGKEIDGRTDIFAFGAVVYEMVTGRKAFEGQSQASVIASILEHEPPPISSLQRMAPPALDRAVKKCLAKDPEERWQNARDLRDELKWIAEGSSQVSAPVTVAARRNWWSLLPWAAVAMLSVAVLSLASVHFREQSADLPRIVFTVSRPTTHHPSGVAPELAPDGKRFLFPGLTPDGRTVLWIRALDSRTARPLPGTENEGYPAIFWSPDGQSVGFFADAKLKKIDISGGPARALADAPDPAGGTWSPDGTILFTPRVGGPLFRVSASEGPATPLFELDRSRQEISHRWPHFLPDGRHFLYGVTSFDARRNGVYLASLDGKEPRLLIGEAERAVYSASGHLLFLRGETLVAQSFDVTSMQMTGEAFPIPGPDGEVIATATSFYSVSPNGVLAYVRARERTVQLRWYDRQGKALEPLGDAAPYINVVLSPDEKRVAADRARGHVWVLERASGIATRLSHNPIVSDPIWSPDGRQLVFTVFKDVSGNLYRKVIAGGKEEPLFESGENKYPQGWLNDGTSIIFMNQQSALYRLATSSDREPELLLPTAFQNDEFRLSPDERWIAYNSLESGRWEVYVASFPSFDGKRQVSSGGGCQPHWRKDVKELFYLDLKGNLMVVDLTTDPSFVANAPRPLFQTSILVNPVVDQYAVTGDGRRFILGTPLGEEEPITVILNWTAGLKR
jgi:eukaryotic-like serine/threonine-protein kinase